MDADKIDDPGLRSTARRHVHPMGLHRDSVHHYFHGDQSCCPDSTAQTEGFALSSDAEHVELRNRSLGQLTR